jgi:hypothetical protein
MKQLNSEIGRSLRIFAQQISHRPSSNPRGLPPDGQVTRIRFSLEAMWSPEIQRHSKQFVVCR